MIISKLNLYEGNTIDTNINISKIFNTKFDIIIGNTPYNEELTKVGAIPLYNKFIEYYIDKCKLLTFIVPSRWFSGGKGLDKFRTMMLNRNDIVYINHYTDANKIFKNVDIKGGVNYFLIDKSYDGKCMFNKELTNLHKYDIIVENKYHSIIDKLCKFDSIVNMYISQDHYKIQTNDKRLKKDINETNIKCYVSKQNGFISYIDKKYIDKLTDGYKVLTTRASFCASSGFGNTFIGIEN